MNVRESTLVNAKSSWKAMLKDRRQASALDSDQEFHPFTTEERGILYVTASAHDTGSLLGNRGKVKLREG